VNGATPTSDEVKWARAKTTTEQHFLALVVLLKCYQRLGCFPKLVDVPAVVVDPLTESRHAR
jgi:hypothetical protein